nr:PREDICTED: methylmalonic aciduria and homocystinuria type D homolog, mitochondrial-like isoform X2 [Saccoglossus kowalevskii]
MRAVSSRMRLFASYRQSQHTAALEQHRDPRDREWPDIKLGLLSPPDRRFPMPGNIGLSASAPSPLAAAIPVHSLDITTLPTRHEKQVMIMEQFFESEEGKAIIEKSEQSSSKKIPNVLECVAQDCPSKLRKGFMELFPEGDLIDDNLTVITLCQKTKNDMSGWSPSVEEERDELTSYFITGAQEICDLLKAEGYWADFVDPSSGLAYNASHTNATLFETDERYKHFGFEIIDLGCCKVLSHPLWGTHAFLGSLFTSAPTDSPIMKKIMQSLRKD